MTPCKILIVCLAVLLGGAYAGPAYAERPNIVVIMTDDQDADSMEVMPRVYSSIAKHGTTFTNTVVSTAVCSPSRATFLTGQYSHNHKVFSNYPPRGGFFRLDHSNTLPVWLQAGGYHTGHIGKYLNVFSDSDGDGVPNGALRIPPGWTEWGGSVDPASYRYFGFSLFENGRPVYYPESGSYYHTDVVAQKAVKFIERRANNSQPFFLSVAFIAPHGGRTSPLPTPAPRHQGVFQRLPLKRTPGLNESDVSDKPSFIRRLPELASEGTGGVLTVPDSFRRRRAALLAVDEAVESIIGALEAAGKLDNTVVIYTSDNGFFQGEHRVAYGKIIPYEPSIRVPLVIRGPGVAEAQTRMELVGNIDLAPTIVELAQIHPGREMNGQSLVPLLRGESPAWRSGLLIESLDPYPAYWGVTVPTFAGVRTDRYAYIEYNNGEKELYDLLKDPFELQNKIDSADYQGAISDLREQLESLKAS